MTPHWLIQWTKTSFTFSFFTLSVNIKASWFFQSATTELSGLSTLDQIQWLWLKDLVQELTISSQEIPLAAWSLLLSQRQQFLNNHLARVSVAPNQQGTHEMKDEVLSSVGEQEGLDTSGYQVSADLDDVEFYWESDQLDVDAVFRPGIDTPFSPTAFDDLEMGGSAENPILLDEEEDRENSPPPTTLVSERPNRPPPLLRSRPFGTRIENVHDYVYRKLFQ